MEKFILKKSNRKGKRYEIVMPKYGHSHHFASDVGKTYIDHKDDKKKMRGLLVIKTIKILIHYIVEYIIVKNCYGLNPH